MLNYLIDRENEEMLRASTRVLSFPDGETRTIQTFRLVWRWYDRLLQNSMTYNEPMVLQQALDWATNHDMPIDKALTDLVGYTIQGLECDGIDLVDDTIKLDIAKRAMERWSARKGNPPPKRPKVFRKKSS